MASKVRHYAVKRNCGTQGLGLMVAACGLSHYSNAELWDIKKKVTCRNCKRTRAYRGK
jgi:hypothetical protein